jgi:hypothetical protein
MAHISPDFKSKKEFKEAVKSGKLISVYSPGIFPAKTDGIETVEAPANYHKWYARVQVKDGYVIKVLS